MFRAQDVKSKKHHIPVINRTPVALPPIVVAIVGPPKVGKSTLMQGIIKHYTKQRIANINVSCLNGFLTTNINVYQFTSSVNLLLGPCDIS